MDVKLGRSRGVATTLAALALMAACKHSDDGDERGAGSGAAICAETAPAYCQHWFSCYPEEAREYYGSMQACQTDEVADCRVHGALAGVAPMTSERWGECNRAYGARACDDMTPAPEVCTTLPGARAVGEACVDERQCATLRCKTPPRTESSADLQLCGTCAPQPVAGDRCVEWDDCGFEGLACEGERCVKQEDVGGPCQTLIGCKDELVCLEGKCDPGRAEGEPCTGLLECAANLRCTGGQCTAALPVGAVCKDDFDCQSHQCDQARCQDSVPKRVGLGEPCGRVDICTSDGRCDEVTSKCVAYKRQGEACARSLDCFYFLACQAGKCQPLSDDVCKK